MKMPSTRLAFAAFMLLGMTNDPFTQWAANYFTPAEMQDASISGPGADPDHDGQTNAQEFGAGTNPRDALSVLKIDSIQWNGRVGIPLKIHFFAVTNRTYSVQCQDYSGAPWIKLTDVPVQTTAQSVEVKDYSPSRYGLRFYRIVTPSQPQ